MLEILFIALAASSLNTFLNYAIGKPSGEFSPYEIFSRYTVWLSIRRLKKLNLYHGYMQQYEDNLKRATKPHEVIQLNNDFKKILYNAADPFFTWERAAGMCPVCTGFWITLISSTIHRLVTVNILKVPFYENLLYLVSVIAISHILIRIFNKVL